MTLLENGADADTFQASHDQNDSLLQLGDYETKFKADSRFSTVV